MFFLKRICHLAFIFNRLNNAPFQALATNHKMSTNPVEFPKTLDGFGYGFNDEGQLRQIDKETGKITDKTFDFNISSDAAKNQRHYEALGEVITEHVYGLLEKEGMHRIYVPDNVDEDKASFIFATNTDLTNCKKLLVLIHGSGVVRAGQWARSLIINQSLNHGTQIPYIKKAKELGYDVIITNTNDVSRIPENSSPVAHASYVWKNVVEKSKPQSVAVVAHSYGGVVVMDLASKYTEYFVKNVFAVGLTDSVHSNRLSGDIRSHLSKAGRHWVTSTKPVDTLLSNDGIACYSAGHTKHEWTSWACMDALFDFFEERYKVFIERQPLKKPKIVDEL